MDLIKNENLKQWIKETYPLMDLYNEDDLLELHFYDIDKFATWLQKKVYDEAIKEAYSQFSDVCQQFVFK